MDTSEYNFKILQLLSDESTYKKVKTDPTTNTLKSTSDLIKKHSEKLNLDVNSLIPSCTKPPRLYGLPKIHKPNAPLRPIVSQIDSPTYKLAQRLAKVLLPLRGHTRAHTKDSYHFVSEIKDLHLADNETMVSFDVQSLFTCLPIEDCISIVTRKLEYNNMLAEYAVLLKHCLTSGYLLWKEEFYKQVDGVAMGSPVSPIVADIFTEDFEEKALLTAPVNPRFYKRKHLAAELQHVKQVLQDNKLRVPRLRHSDRVKPATVERVPAVLPYVRGVTDKVDYILKRASIKTYYKKPKKISQFLPSVKCNIPLQDAGVYKLDCECGLSYIGQTKRSIETRVKEHIADVKHRRSGKSAVCEHVQDRPHHYISFDKPQILAKEHRFLPRMIREAIEIKKHPNFNREDGWVLPPAWDPIINKIKPKPKHTTARLHDTISSFCVNRTKN
ncbi:unnamed protein product [Parnassius apollo]|uniref:(apollo) hypothetical protein n=1 Tax=Parnassius apollo TaxID=110799 RepID=A0A8S3WAZ9_PARAO|nr:unnamed protein product [Parnassius apollo]